MTKTPISEEISLSDKIEGLNDRERIEWITALIETIREEETIDAVRKLVNDAMWDDQAP